MRFKTWMGSAVLAPAVFACAAQQQTADGEPTRPGGIEIGFADKEGLGVVPAGAEDGGNAPSGAQQAGAWIKGKPALREGWHNQGLEDEYVVILASNAIARDRNQPYGYNRQVAFELARLKAGLALAAAAGVRMEAIADGFASEVGMSSDELLAYIGSKFKNESVAEVVEGLNDSQRVSIENFSMAIARECDAMIAGLQVFKVFEGPEDLAIIATWSNNTRQVVEAIRDPADPIRGKAAQVSIADWAESIGEELLYSHGCQVRTDQNGEVGLVMFGQNDLGGSSRRFYDSAKRQAELNADAALSRFLAESVAASASRGLASVAVESGYGSGGLSIEQLNATFTEYMKSASRLASMPSQPGSYVAEFTHPANADLGAKTVCVVKYINVSSLKAQDRMARWMQANAIQDSVVGRPKPVVSDPSEGASAPRPKPKPRTSGGQGATGEAP